MPVSLDAFGRLLTDPSTLTPREMIDVARRLAGKWQASPSLDEAWFGQRLSAWLHAGGRFEQVLGIAPTRESRMSAAMIVRRDETARLLLRFSAAVGGDGRASRILRGIEPVPDPVRGLVDELRARQAPASRRSFVRARAATR